MSIYFYIETEEYGCFSNFSPHGFKLEGKYWPTSESYYQAKKFEGTEYEEVIRNCETPALAAKEGRDKGKPIREDWEEVKDDVMRTAVHAKFTTNLDIAQILLSTGDEILVENSPTDYYWGCGEEGTGKNMLGAILMEERKDLRNG